MKKCVLVLVFFCVSLASFASLPVVSSVHRLMPGLKSISSENFEFIYPSELKSTAEMLRNNAEMVLHEAEEYFGVEWKLGKISVVLTSDEKMLNAYYSPFTASHIVLYITHPDSGDLLNFENTTLSVFEHEFAHYFIMKLHGSVMNGFSTFFGDYFCNGIFLPNFMVEGLSVAFESRRDEGRLNYPFATFILREAKREQKFPHYRLLGGNLRTSPYKNLEYIAGGAFVAYIRNYYGKQKFYEFINAFKNMFSFPHLFYSVYGVSLDDAWSDFVASIPSNDDAILLKDVISANGNYQFLKYRKSGFYYVDSVSSAVYKFENENSTKLFNIDAPINSFDVSRDEKYILVSVTYDNNAVAKLFDISKRIQIAEFKNARHAGFANIGIETIVVYVSDDKERTECVSAHFDGSEIARFAFKDNTEVLAFSPFVKDKFAFVYKEGKEVALAIADRNFNSIEKFLLSNVTVQGLSLSFSESDETVTLSLSFVYNENIFNSSATPGLLLFTFTHDGKLLKTEISTENVKGGMLFPFVNDSEEVVFVNTRFGFSSISKVNKTDLHLFDVTDAVTTTPILRYREDVNERIEDVGVFATLDEVNYSRFLRALPFFSRGALVPFVFYDVQKQNYSVLPSLSYYTSDPTESITSALHFAYLPYNNNVFGRNPKWFEVNSILLEAGMNLDILPFSLYLALRPKFYFDSQTGTSISLNGYIRGDYHVYFDSPYHYLSTSLLLGYEKRLYGNLNIYENGFYASADVFYNNVHYTGYGYNQMNGWRARASFSASEVLMNSPLWLFDVSLIGRFYHSRIIPIQNQKNLTYNLPFYITLEANYKNKGVTEGLSLESVIHNNLFSITPSLSVILFAINIENVLSHSVPITFNSFVINAFTSFGYSHFDFENGSFNHRLDIKLGVESYFTISPGFLGMAIEAASLDLGVRYEMIWRSDSMRNNSFYPLALYKYGRVSLICQTSIGV